MAEVRSNLKAKILDAEANRQEGFDIELTLTPDEFDLLRSSIPQNIGGKTS